MQRVGEEVDPESTFAVGVGAFARLLGLAFAVAFCSLGVQTAGLLGEGGVQPLARLVEWETLPGLDAFLDMPSLFWLGQSDGMIRSVWILGALSGSAAALGLVPRLFLLAATACWLSFTSLSIPPTASQGLGFAFLGYAWDGLLVELGCVAVLVAPGGLRSRGAAAPSRSTAFALRILLVRIVFGAALSPYLLGDGSWSADGALAQHLWTTPLPSWPGLVAAGGSGFVLGAADLLSELLGLVLIFGVFGPRGVRHGVLLLLLVNLAAQAVFVPRGVWPLAVAALALSGFDDAAFGRLKLVAASRPQVGGLLSLLSSAALAALLAVGLYVTAVDLGTSRAQEAPSGLRLAVGRWQVANHYAPLVDVPSDRPALTLFGSADGEIWEPIDLRSSPRDPFEAPPGPSLHLRRLDWAMDRAARQIKAGEMPPPWLVLTMVGLLEGRADVRGLLREGSFADVPPRALRLELHDLTPASPGERGDRGMWWYRWPGLDVGAPVMVEDGRLVPAQF
ncbi:MAG: lipase maturation factor family protein [Planctomycetota bacterium]|nr:lipase maturation factor family protein [Planctomycetota bacterium]MDA0933112.1 lipase maturation factor family protein [Planctomycetota bacterium]MDA1221009.1 lipase maturation factor family protein [Planctomycetota bacterium]